MKIYKTQTLDEIMENIKTGTILFFRLKDDWKPFVPGTEIDFVKAVIKTNTLIEKSNVKAIVHCNRFRLEQNTNNEWIIYNGKNTDYEFLYAFEQTDLETYKLLGKVEENAS